MLALALLGGALWQSRETSIRESRVFSSLAQRSIDQGLYDRSMRYALQGLPTARALPWTYWSQQLESKLAAAAFASALRVELKGHTDVLSSAVFSPDGTMVLTASYDKTAKVWSTTSGEVVTVLTGHEGVVLVAAFSPDGSRVVTASNDRTARVWEVPSGKPLDGHEGTYRLCNECRIQPRRPPGGQQWGGSRPDDTDMGRCDG